MTFKPGTSGNANGRPKNSGHRQKLFNKFIEPHTCALLEKALEMALNGNEPMLRVFLERMLPPKPKDDAVIFELPNIDLTDAESLLYVGAKIIQDIADNVITKEQGKILLEIVTLQRKNIETSVLSARITEIEHIFKLRKEEQCLEKY